MLLSLTPSQFDIKNIIVSEKTKNTILTSGDFYRLYYSDESMSLNGIYIIFKLKNFIIEPYFNKIKCSFDHKHNGKVIEQLKLIESQILNSFDNKNKKVYRIEEQLSNHFIKIFSDKCVTKQNIVEMDILLKISGIWYNKNEYGLTFRFFFTHPLEKMK